MCVRLFTHCPRNVWIRFGVHSVCFAVTVFSHSKKGTKFDKHYLTFRGSSSVNIESVSRSIALGVFGWAYSYENELGLDLIVRVGRSIRTGCLGENSGTVRILGTSM